jgi:hypothetical protein
MAGLIPIGAKLSAVSNNSHRHDRACPGHPRGAVAKRPRIYGGFTHLRGHGTHCVIGSAMNGLDALIFGNVYHVPVIFLPSLSRVAPSAVSEH